VVESSLRVLYRGDWPARLWGAIPGACDVACVTHTLALLPPGHTDIRIGFVSDLHVGPTTPKRLLDRAFARLARARLDLLLLGGDFVFLDATEERAFELASRIESVPAPRKIAVLGNHDLWTHHDVIERALARAGVELLINRNEALDARHGNTRLVGLDDPWTGVPDVARAFDGAMEAGTLVVLCHSPDALPAVQTFLADRTSPPDVLYVCGHTHGGQIATPWGPVVVPGRVGKRHPHGLYRLGTTMLYVSCGVGAVELPMRAYARPEVVVLRLRERT
jgi:predicted MPP superfamily phosphohydrolase